MTLVAAIMLGSLAGAASASDRTSDGASNGVTIANGTTILNDVDIGAAIRLRSEIAQSDALPDRAEALTLGMDAFLAWEPTEVLTVRGEIGAVIALAGSYDDGEGAPRSGPVIADPGKLRLNELFVEYRPLPMASLRVGRQRIVHGEQRFIGAVGFRQSDQSFDAVRAEVAGPLGATLDVSYLGAIKRPFGPRGRDDRFVGDGLLTKIDVPTPAGTLTAFRHSLAFADAAGQPLMQGGRSTSYGLALNGRRGQDTVSVDWSAAYAWQDDRLTGSTARYVMARLGARRAGAFLDARYERLGGGPAPFSTPLGTNHAFQGHADMFLVTPSGGVEDLSLGFGAPPVKVGPFTRIGLTGRVHHFAAADAAGRYGNELDVEGFALWQGYRFSIERAGYRADGFGASLTRWWLSLTKTY